MFKRLLTLATHKIHNLPIVVLMPHSSCNCRCIMCDIWKANQNKKEISAEQLSRHMAHFRRLGVREVVLSGGEALLHSDLWKLCSHLKALNIKITLLSTGLLLQRYVDEILKFVDNVIISLDGSEAIHDKIRNIPNGYKKISEGVKALKEKNPGFRITSRCVLQRHNYTDFIGIVKGARNMGLDQISFLAADVSTSAFNRNVRWDEIKTNDVALNLEESKEFETIIEDSFHNLEGEYRSGFIAESPGKIRSIAQYYKALNGLGKFPAVVCNAPWVSAVIESDGSVLPCFFHKSLGNIYEQDFLSIINSPSAIAWRKELKMATDPICSKCVCSLKLGVAQMN